VLVTMLHFSTIIKVISYSFYIKDYVKSLFTMVVAGFVGHYAFTFMSIGSIAIKTLLAIGIMSIVYFILLIIFQLITKEEMNRIPFIDTILTYFLKTKK